MPRGNDAAAHEEFKASVESQYGTYNNAEELIRAHNASIDAGVRRAGLTQIDLNATEALREEGLDDVESKFEGIPSNWTLENFAVRGNAIVGVFIDGDGVHHKKVAAANSRYTEPVLSDDERAAADTAAHQRTIAAETARLRAEADAAIAKVKAEEEERVGKELAKVREQADADIAAAQAAAQDDKAAESEPKPKSKPGAKTTTGGSNK